MSFFRVKSKEEWFELVIHWHKGNNFLQGGSLELKVRSIAMLALKVRSIAMLDLQGRSIAIILRPARP